jgi:hypothetical protein
MKIPFPSQVEKREGRHTLGFLPAHSWTTHFDTVRQAKLNEANSIRTAYLRADLLPDPIARKSAIFCASIRRWLIFGV